MTPTRFKPRQPDAALVEVRDLHAFKVRYVDALELRLVALEAELRMLRRQLAKEEAHVG